eukprot:COSAG06_NODE_13670_length_1233_cov_0.993827_2_plen_225_part_01
MGKKRRCLVMVEEIDCGPTCAPSTSEVAPPGGPASGRAESPESEGSPVKRRPAARRVSGTARPRAAHPPIQRVRLKRQPLASTCEQCALDLVAAVTEAQRTSSTRQAVLSSIKRSFVERDFAAIFGNDENLLYYMCAYVPSRALCYLSVLAKLVQTPAAVSALAALSSSPQEKKKTQQQKQQKKKAATHVSAWCLGAGPGSEAVAFATWCLLGLSGGAAAAAAAA